MQITARVFFMSVALACGACSTAADIPVRKSKELTKTFFKQSRAAQQVKFEQLDPEEQYAVYICGNQYIHPPMLELANYYAAHGHAAVDLLHERLKAAKDDLTIRDITRAFRIMKDDGAYDARQNPELMRLLETKIAAMRYAGWKDTTEIMFADLKRGP